MDRKIAAAGLGLSLLTVLGLGTIQSAQAQDLRDIGRTVVNDVLNGRNGGYGYGQGNFGRGGEQLQNLDRRADRLSFRLRSALNNGTINPRQFNLMNSQVRDCIAQIHDMRASGSFNYDQRNMIDNRLDRLENRLNMQTAGRPGGWY